MNHTGPQRGTWRPRQGGNALFIVQCAVLSACVVRGLDYLRPDVDPGSVLSRVQDSAPLPAWGLCFIGAAAVVLAGLIGHWGTVVAVGHMAAMVAYAGIAHVLIMVTGYGPGVRTPWELAVLAVIHGALGFSIFATLRRRELTAALPPEAP